MQSKNFIFIAAFAGLIAVTLATRLLGRNSVFSAENFVKKEGEKIDDMLEKKKMSNRLTNQIKKSKIFILYIIY
jgi:hypothetical protein